MNRYSWHTTTEKDSGGWYKCTAIVVFPGNTVKFDTYPFYKPNRKGGHRHNQWKNATARMRKCHICGDPIFGGITERLYFLNNSYQNVCRGCFRAIEEDARRHNYETIKEIEMMEADL